MDTSDLHIGGGIHDLEVDGNRNFKWTSDLYCLYFNDTIESITLEIFSDFKSNCWYYLDDVNEDSKITLSYNSGFNRIKIINKNFFKLNVHQNIFIPGKINKNSNDFRKLSYRIYNIDVVYTNGKIKRLDIKDIMSYSRLKLIHDLSKIPNSTILFINYLESKGGAEKMLDNLINHIKKNHSYSVLTCLPNGNNSKYWNKKHDSKYLSAYHDINVLKDESKQLSSKYTVVYANTLMTIKVIHFMKMFNPNLYCILHIHELESAFVMMEKNLYNNDLSLHDLFKSVDVFIVVANRTKEILVNDYNININNIVYTDSKL